jgi:hypothetical protein
MKHLAIVYCVLVLAGCASDERRARLEQGCAGEGLTPGSSAFSECVRRAEASARASAAQARDARPRNCEATRYGGGASTLTTCR